MNTTGSPTDRIRVAVIYGGAFCVVCVGWGGDGAPRH